MYHQDRAASDQIEAAIRAQPVAFSPTPKPEKIMTAKQIIEKMAKAFIETAAITSGATVECLRNANFTDAQIEKYGEKAANRARKIQGV